MTEQKPSLTRKDIARIARVDIYTVRDWDRAGKLKRVGQNKYKAIFYDGEESIKFIEERAARLKEEREEYWG